MENLNQAANEVETAEPQNETTEPTEETTVEPGNEPAPIVEPVEDVSKTQAFAKRLKEETEKAEQRGRDSYIAKQNYEWKGKPITTESEYEAALHEQEAEDTFRQKYSHLDEEVIQELLAGKQFREKFEQKESETKKEQAEREVKEKEQASQLKDQQEFLKMFKDENSRSWEETDTLPPEVIEFLNQGKSLADSYTKYLASTYKQKLTAQEVNTKNANSSTGSVTGNGNVNSEIISSETFEANKHDQKWVMKNFSKINESRAKW